MAADPPCDLKEALTRIAVLEERVHNRDEALKIQANEYHRRLDELNHAHAQRMARDADYLPREIHEQAARELLAWRRGVDETLAVLRGRRDANLGLLGSGLSVLAILIAIWSGWAP